MEKNLCGIVKEFFTRQPRITKKELQIDNLKEKFASFETGTLYMNSKTIRDSFFQNIEELQRYSSQNCSHKYRVKIRLILISLKILVKKSKKSRIFIGFELELG